MLTTGTSVVHVGLQAPADSELSLKDPERFFFIDGNNTNADFYSTEGPPWESGQPDDAFNNDPREDCVIIRKSTLGWHDSGCGGNRGFLCQRPCRTSEPTLSPTTTLFPSLSPTTTLFPSLSPSGTESPVSGEAPVSEETSISSLVILVLMALLFVFIVSLFISYARGKKNVQNMKSRLLLLEIELEAEKRC